MRHQKTGKLGERYAQEYLESRGYRVIQQNFHSRFGEIDLICFKDKLLVFVEVKARTSKKFGLGEECVGYQKLRKILKTIHKFFLSYPEYRFQRWRIDLVALQLAPSGYLKNINHIKNLSYG